MSGNRFSRYELRTTDVAAARSFYAEVLGADVWGPGVEAVPLPERAAAHGAPAHWLGHIGVADVDATADRLLAAGWQRLGPPQPGARAVLRDPSGAVLAVAAEIASSRPPPIGWHLLLAQDDERAFAAYAAPFGWTRTDVVDMGAAAGRQQVFAWDDAGPAVGSVANTARPPQIHPQWLFFFTVPDIQTALARTRALGGTALATTTTWTGDIVVPCEDPQRAAFGLHQPAPGGRPA